MFCRYCGGDRVVWRQRASGPFTFCQDCRRKNCERGTRALPHGVNECDRAQIQLKML